MTIKLYAHPFSSYCQKAIIAFYENDVPFDFVMLDGSEPVASEFAALWPIKRFPLLVEGERVVSEATMIVEYLAVHHPGPVKLIPEDADAAIEVRMLDRFFDNYVMNTQSRIVFDALREEGRRDAQGVEEARAMLDTAYAWLDGWMEDREWAAGGAFSLADCAAAPALLYADWTHAIPERFANVWAYRARLLARPSYARALDEARPYRHYFPLGAPGGRD
ncbi:MAG: Maleylacetoacetate isomerase / Glutathione S-transferase [Sphingomonas bacterium]|uniref:glutathione S-transferase family protein n=1 Tax=Sphingomonas bacterium TaxID=1895847 RepID=UPI0026229B22|nr:glutathione S-transferase family protein [Sphingomonas bacterium]MDB5707030.1 Maleylacetoacetate isomerase / Glutathione S-transferase [Sphingomonas bacterium]